MSQPYEDELNPGSTSSAVKFDEPLGTVICRMMAVSGKRHSCGVSAQLDAKAQILGTGNRILDASNVGFLDSIIPIDAELRTTRPACRFEAASRETSVARRYCCSPSLSYVKVYPVFDLRRRRIRPSPTTR